MTSGYRPRVGSAAGSATAPPGRASRGQVPIRAARPRHADLTAGGMTARVPVDRTRFVRTLTFWLRPAFLLRVLKRFQLIAGFDRAMALASSTLTALIPLAILAGALVPHVQAEDAARWII